MHHQLFTGLLDFLFPKKCVGCKKVGTYFCSKCISDIKQSDLVCPFCEKLSLGGVVHPVCKRKYGLDGLWSLGIYQYPLKNAIQKLKYKWITPLAESLINITIEYWAKKGTFLLDRIKKDQGKDWILVSVPLHKKRQNWRGFNQAELLAQQLARNLGLEYRNALRRIKYTKPQVGQDFYSRKRNIKGAFALTKPLGEAASSASSEPSRESSSAYSEPSRESSSAYTLNANILLVDDVWTTGSTLKECTLVLKRGGAKSVWALTIAR